MSIQPQHYEEWRASTVADPIIRANVESLGPDSDHFDSSPILERLAEESLGSIGGWSDQLVTKPVASILDRYESVCDGGWWVSGLDPLNGWERCRWGQFKPDRPRLDSEKGKPIKYEAPAKTAPRAIFLDTGDSGYWERVTSSNYQNPLVITEGAKKAGALLSAGYAAIALVGVNAGYRVRDAEGHACSPYLCDDLAAVIKPGHSVYLAFDQDSKLDTRRKVKNALNKLAALLVKAGATVHICKWSPKEGKGVDDFITGGGDIAKVITEAKLWSPPPTPEPVPTPAGEQSDQKEKRPRLAIAFEAVDRVLGARLAFNELTNQIELDGDVVDDPIDLRLTLALDHGISVSQADSEAIFKRLARTNAYHPVQRYLEQVSLTYGDDTAILQGMADRYFGAGEPIYQTYFKKMLVGAVARVLDPGCKLDTAVILQGPQGYGKSTFLRTLAGPDWFDDSMGAAQGERDERLKLHQFWFLEWGELEAVFRKKDIASTKAFLSSQVDTVRPPYGRQAVTLKRRSIIVGSTNQDDFLTDPTGNRRFWVVPVRKRIDVATLATERDQIWAAAVSLYRSGFPWWLTPDEEAIAAEFNESWRAEDPWTSAIRAYLLDNHEKEITTAQILNYVLDIEVGLQTKAHEMRISEVMKALGWERVQRRSGNRRVRLWVKPECHNLPDQGCDIGCDKPEPLQNGSFDEYLQNGVTTSDLGCDIGCDSQNGDGAKVTDVCHNLHNLLPQNNRHFLVTTNGNGHQPTSLDISDEKLAQLLGGDSYDN